MPRAAAPITLTVENREALQERVRAHRVEHRDRQRARVVWLAAEGWSNEQIALEVGLHVNSVRKWRDRYARGGLAALEDEPRPGRPGELDPRKVNVVLSEVVQPPAPRNRWSVRSMARHAGLSKSTVQKLWAQNDLKPHLSRTFKLSADPAFEIKFWDVIGLYLAPPDQALVLCCDEKSQIQALQRTQPGLALQAGHLPTQTHDYCRHGTVTLFAALDYLQGKIIARTERRHTHREWLRFLQQIEEETPAGVQLHLIVDNYATHKHAKVKAWLARHPRFHLHFTPTSSSWLNLVERFFRDLSQQALVGASFGSVPELLDSIWHYLAEHNLRPKRYVWRADGQRVLEKIRRAWEVAVA
jgi:transposase/transcriptional regulator with XRE-family HTH domain